MESPSTVRSCKHDPRPTDIATLPSCHYHLHPRVLGHLENTPEGHILLLTRPERLDPACTAGATSRPPLGGAHGDRCWATTATTAALGQSLSDAPDTAQPQEAAPGVQHPPGPRRSRPQRSLPGEDGSHADFPGGRWQPGRSHTQGEREGAAATRRRPGHEGRGRRAPASCAWPRRQVPGPFLAAAWPHPHGGDGDPSHARASLTGPKHTGQNPVSGPRPGRPQQQAEGNWRHPSAKGSPGVAPPPPRHFSASFPRGTPTPHCSCHSRPEEELLWAAEPLSTATHNYPRRTYRHAHLLSCPRPLV